MFYCIVLFLETTSYWRVQFTSTNLDSFTSVRSRNRKCNQQSDFRLIIACQMLCCVVPTKDGSVATSSCYHSSRWDLGARRPSNNSNAGCIHIAISTMHSWESGTFDLVGFWYKYIFIQFTVKVSLLLSTILSSKTQKYKLNLMSAPGFVLYAFVQS